MTLNEKLNRVLADHSSGSSEVTSQFALALAEVIDPWSGEAADFRRQLQGCFDQAIQAHGEMAAVWNLAAEMFGRLRSGGAWADPKSLADYLRRYVTVREDNEERLAATASDHFGDAGRVFTVSRSGTVLKTLISMAEGRKDLTVYLPESRPMVESASVCEQLASRGVKVVWFVDAASSLFLSECDLLLVGADRVTEIGVLNKIGTFAATRAAGDLGVPAYAAFLEEKIIPSTHAVPTLDRDPREVLKSAPKGVEVRNPTYEEIPLDLFDGFFTERGLACAQDLRDKTSIRILPNLPFRRRKVGSKS